MENWSDHCEPCNETKECPDAQYFDQEKTFLSRLKDRCEEVQSIQQHLKQKSHTLAEAEAENFKLKATLASLKPTQQDMKDAQLQLERLRNDLAVVQHRKAEFESLLSKQQGKGLEQQCEVFKKEKSQIESQLGQLNIYRCQLEQKLREARKTVKQTESQNHDAICSIKSQICSLRKEIELMSLQNDRLIGECQKSQNNNRLKEEEIQHACAKVDKLYEEIHDAQVKLTRKQECVEPLKQRIAGLVGQKEQNKTNMMVKVEAEQNRLKQLRQLLSHNRIKLEEIQMNLKTVNQRVKKQESEEEKFKRKAKQVSKALECSEDRVTELHDTIRSLQAQLQAQKVYRNKLSSQKSLQTQQQYQRELLRRQYSDAKNQQLQRLQNIISRIKNWCP